MNDLASWLRRAMADPQIVFLSVLLLSLFAIVLTLGNVLAPVLASLVIAYLLDGIVVLIQRRGVSRLQSVLLVYLLFLSFFLVLLLGALPLILRQTADLVQQLPAMLAAWTRTLTEFPQRYPGLISEEQLDMLVNALSAEVPRRAQQALSWSLAGLMDLMILLVYLILMPLLVFFFMKDKELILSWFRQLLPDHKGIAHAVWKDVDRQISNYVRGKIWEVLIAWGVYCVVFYAFGLKYAMLLSLLVGLSVIIPYVGAVVVTVPVLLIAWLQWGWSSHLLWLAGAYFFIHALDGNVLVPLLFSEVVDLHPVAIIVAVLVFGSLWGFWGVFFAIPLATLAQAILTAWPKRSGNGIKTTAIGSVLLWVMIPSALASPDPTPVIGHQLALRIDPAAGTLAAQDRLTWPEDRAAWEFLLHADLEPRVVAGAAELVPLGHHEHLGAYRLRLAAPGPVTLAYGGRLRHALETQVEGMGRASQWSLGTIDPDGVFLTGASGWYPRIPDTRQRLALQTELPPGWIAVAPGAGPGPDPAGTGRAVWSETQPLDELVLTAAPFTLYRAPGAGYEAQVYLRQPDPELAQRYLDATHRAIARYAALIGPYPFAKFALVENFWETGYGLPSFTLLGARVIRLPFIVDTAYPHEILHNWWGNGVYPAATGGNWSEGLTTYLADHLRQEERGAGAAYRRGLLANYAERVRTQADAPLTEFRARHDDASQAIGYGKSALLFHMTRRLIGDAAFIQGLRDFYADWRFRSASFDDLRLAFAQASGVPLTHFFQEWTTRPGAPRLRLAAVAMTPAPEGAGYRVTGRLEQIQDAAPFPLQVPVRIEQAAGPPVWRQVALTGRAADFTADCPTPPQRLRVDPDYDLFRALLPGEQPVSLGRLFGAERGVLLIPAAAPEPRRAAWRALAAAWLQGRPGWEIRDDASLPDLPADRPVWLLGWDNRFLDRFANAPPEAFALDPGARTLRLAPDDPPRAVDIASLALTRTQGAQALGWLAAPDPAAIAALARRLPHYGKYGALIFAASDPARPITGEWPAGDAELTHWFVPPRTLPPVAPAPALTAE